MNASKSAAVLAVLALIGALAPQPADATHARPKAGSPFNVALVPSYEPCASPNRVHAAPLSYASCNPPAQTSLSLTMGTPDANGAPAKGIASVLYKAVGASGGIDDQDVQMTTSVIDVRCRPAVTTCGSANTVGGSDYVGEIETNTPIQVTDHNSGPAGAGSDPATVLQVDFPYLAGCVATTDATVGATCSITTSMDAQVPGTIPEIKRMTVELDSVTVWDGGPDGLVASPDNALFLVQGVLVP